MSAKPPAGVGRARAGRPGISANPGPAEAGRAEAGRGEAGRGEAGRGEAGRAEAGRTAGYGADADDAPADPEAVARLICLRLLTAAPRTKAELAEALRRRRVPAEAAAAVLGRFTELGLIDDATFAGAWVESRHHGRGLARRALAAELDRRGVAGRDIQAAVARLSPETEEATARALAERKLASLPGQPPQAQARRLVGLLARKGYPAGLAYRVVREVLADAGQDPAASGLDGEEPFEPEAAELDLPGALEG